MLFSSEIPKSYHSTKVSSNHQVFQEDIWYYKGASFLVTPQSANKEQTAGVCWGGNTFSVQGQTVNVSALASHAVSVATILP